MVEMEIVQQRIGVCGVPRGWRGWVCTHNRGDDANQLEWSMTLARERVLLRNFRVFGESTRRSGDGVRDATSCEYNGEVRLGVEM